MNYAKEVDGSLVVDRVSALFPNVSFPPEGPNADWLAANGCYVVSHKTYDSAIEKAVRVEPYLENGEVFLTSVVALDQAEIDVMAAVAASQELQAANSTFEGEVADVRRAYTDSEIASWPVQLSEARQWLADSTAETPFLDAVISESGEAKADYVASILAKAATYSAVVGKALGRKRKKINPPS